MQIVVTAGVANCECAEPLPEKRKRGGIDPSSVFFFCGKQCQCQRLLAFSAQQPAASLFDSPSATPTLGGFPFGRKTSPGPIWAQPRAQKGAFRLNLLKRTSHECASPLCVARQRCSSNFRRGAVRRNATSLSSALLQQRGSRCL